MSFRLRFSGQDVRVLGEECAFDGYFRVQRVRLEHRDFNGGWCAPVTREVFERGDSVGVLPYDPRNDAFILVEQFRAGILRDAQSPWMLEIIAGIIDDGEREEDVLRREALEEADCELSDLLPIARYYPSAGACSERTSLYCARVERAASGTVQGLAGEGENILVHRLARETVMQMLRDGQINNGHTLTALQWFALNWPDLRQRWMTAEPPTHDD